MTPEILEALLRHATAGAPAILATRLSDGLQWVLPDADAPMWLQSQAVLVLAQDRSIHITVEQHPWFLHLHAPPSRLLIVGAVHIAQALTRLAAVVGLATIVIDPRQGFASAERFPGIAVRTDWPDEALTALQPDRRTAIVTLTHDPKLDDPALDLGIRSEAFFVGALGSRKTHAARLERLRAQGCGQEALDRIRGPVGLPIGSQTPAEIALSILAEIVAARRGSALSVR